MARKRGGLAGFYDRNKGVLQAAAPFIAGAVGGPLAGAAVGAAMRGFDREGQSGIGFDLGQGLQGGISGYGAGSLGASAKNMFTGAMANRAAASRLASLEPVDMASKIGITPGMTSATQGMGAVAPVTNPALSVAAFPSAAIAPSAPASVMPRPSSAAVSMPSSSASQFNTTPSLADINRTVGAAPKPAGLAPEKPAAWYKSREGLDALSRGGQAAASIMGSQAQSAQAQREYEDQQRRLQAQAELMALFAPQMGRNIGVDFGAYKFPYNR